jgi:hypothetical protein
VVDDVMLAMNCSVRALADAVSDESAAKKRRVRHAQRAQSRDTLFWTLVAMAWVLASEGVIEDSESTIWVMLAYATSQPDRQNPKKNPT